MIDIQPQYLSLGKLLAGRLFRIPEYQRAYSWHSRQRADLFSDIEKVAASPNDSIHFMATVVGLRRDKRTIITDEHQVVEVVDGQQRLTTLVLLLKAAAQALNENNTLEVRIRREIEETLVKPDEHSLLLLQTNHDSSHHFAEYLRKGSHPSSDTARTLADRELLKAMTECELFVARWGQRQSLSDLVALLKNRLTFIFHEIADEATVYTVLEVLNSRGLEVSWFDRLKSILMGMAFKSSTGNQVELIDELHLLWRDIYACIGLRQGMSTEALRFAATLRLQTRPSRPLGEEDAVETLRTQASGEPKQIVGTTQWIKSVTEAVDRLSQDRRKNAVRRIAQARLLATAAHLRSDFSDGERDRILKRWENVTFRIYGMMSRDARTRVGDYVRLAWRILNEKISADDVLKGLKDIGDDFPIDEAVDSVRDSDCYTDWQEELRCFFFRYEEHLASEAGQNFDNEQWNRIWEVSAADSIEHILPQSKGPEGLVHRIGNLVLLPPRLNSKLGSKAPTDKAGDYQKTGLLIAQAVVRDLPDWGEEKIAAREDSLLKWALSEWAD